jgi:hypothetical protein
MCIEYNKCTAIFEGDIDWNGKFFYKLKEEYVWP